VRHRADFDEAHANPLKKVSAKILANAVDEKVEETE
jgi:4-hydroxythreonine-4-phosphate dehydrogenase